MLSTRIDPVTPGDAIIAADWGTTRRRAWPIEESVSLGAARGAARNLCRAGVTPLGSGAFITLYRAHRTA